MIRIIRLLLFMYDRISYDANNDEAIVDRSVKLWDGRTGKLLHRFNLNNKFAKVGLHIDARANVFVIAAIDRVIHIFDGKNGKPLKVFEVTEKIYFFA